jgi:hypothetical protein
MMIASAERTASLAVGVSLVLRYNTMATARSGVSESIKTRHRQTVKMYIRVLFRLYGMVGCFLCTVRAPCHMATLLKVLWVFESLREYAATR